MIDFLIVAFALFLLIRQINRLANWKKEEEKAETKECPYCLSPVPVKATRCAHCTSHLVEEKEEGPVLD